MNWNSESNVKVINWNFLPSQKKSGVNVENDDLYKFTRRND